MATSPIFSATGEVSSNGTTGMAKTLITAAADVTGVSANNVIVFTAGATSGGYVERLHCQALGTNVQTVLRVYINNGSANTTATNNSFVAEYTLPATTASATAAIGTIIIPLNIALNPGFTILVGLGTTVATGWAVSAIGGKY